MNDYPDVHRLDEARQRLVRRFGNGVQSWMEELPGRRLVLQTDPSMGALLMEEIEPGTPLQDSGTYPALSEVAQLLTAFHTQGTPHLVFPSLADRVAY